MTGAAAADRRELAELREYLGADFDERLLHGHELALMRELDDAPDEETLYRTSQMYLYDLTVFSLSGTKDPYLDLLRAAVPPGARLLDYGCGIGADGLKLLEAGYRVTFADFDNPSTAYLRWRLERRGLKAEIVDLDAGPVPAGHDLAFAFDVIEHVADPFAFLGAMEAAADRVLVNFLEPEPGDTTLHHDLPVAALVRHAARQRLHAYRVLHRRSHVVLYETGAATRAARTRNAGRVAARRAAHLVRRAVSRS